jgi:mono/diheme cytochrome c family protein
VQNVRRQSECLSIELPALAVCRCLLLLAAVAGTGPLWASEAVPDTADVELYTQRIQPLLAARCYKCHGPETQEAGLRLDTRDGLESGGASGELVSGENPDDSLLLVAVSYRNEDLQMPPDAKLSQAEIDDLRQWVARGMPHPDAGRPPVKDRVEATAGKEPAAIPGADFWSFQPPAASPLPAVGGAEWCRTPVDRFVLAALEARGLSPMTDAGKRTWLRRVTLDLTGLPPTEEEVSDFLRDGSPDAEGRMIDRLLGSPHYGIRWGRHWLDVARYADSNGLDENIAHGNAWRYHDYVIDSMNRDKPFRQFLREQVAGDLLPWNGESQRHEQLIATAFLSLGAKVLAEVDELKMEMDIVDEQIDTFGRALLGLTLGCARCHDHKFDPIRTEDYYSLVGVFRSTRTMEHFKKIARWNENVIASVAERAVYEEYERKLKERRELIQRAVEEANQALLAKLGPDAKLPKNPDPMYPEAAREELKRLRDELEQWQKAAPALASAMGVSEGSAADAAVCIRGSHLTTGSRVPRGVPALLKNGWTEVAEGESGRRQLADWLVDARNPLTARVIVNRVWRWHFGRGLVETTDNFGNLGERPVNQALLDWLAVWFVDNGWSLKQLHRLIVNSSVYRQQSAAPGTQVTDPRTVADPDNQLLWHFPIRRLEAEALRDAWLAVSGQLDTAMGGLVLHVANREFLFDHTSKDNTRYDSRRRAVYLPVIRNHTYDLFQLFDATDATVPNGDRASSTVSTQALFLLNSPFVLECARELARQSMECRDESERIQRLYSRCLSRPATPRETERAVAFVSDFAAGLPVRAADQDTARQEAWTALCHTLLCSNEFLYVR